MRWKMLLAVFLIAACTGCAKNELETFPAEFLGEWETTTPKFRDFTFTLTEKTIIFNDANAESGCEVYPLDKRTKDVDKSDRAIYTVHYTGEDGLKFKFAFYYAPVAGGQIILKNQSGIIWTKRRQSKKFCPADGLSAS